MDRINSALYIEKEALKDYASAAARLLTPEGECPGRRIALTLLRDCREIQSCYRLAALRYGEMAEPPAQWEWLLDNWYMVQREYRSVLPELERAGAVRACSEGALVFALCWSLLLSGQGEVTEERLQIYLSGFERVRVLRCAELELLPAALSAAVIHAIAAVCSQLRQGRELPRAQKHLEAFFTSLRLLSVMDLEKLLRKANITNATLEGELSGDYAGMDNASKQQYLKRIEKLARKSGMEEHLYAAKLVERARELGCHTGFLLFGERSRVTEGLYIAGNVLGTLFLSIFLAFLSGSGLLALLLVIPVSELIKSLLDFILLHLVPPRRMLRMDTEKGIPPEGGTICVISTLLGAGSDAGRLEELYHACKGEGPALCFGLLADLPEAQEAQTDQDQPLLQEAQKTVEELNRKYGPRFYLFTRERSFDGERYSGRERKRGAILELARLLCDRPSQLRVSGDRDALNAVRYIVTLDSDSRIYPGTVGQLVGAMLHPLNRPQIDEKYGLVCRGHAIIHPRIDTDLESAGETDFSIIFSGGGGSDPYGSLCGELYMDAFDSGGFAGKGIIDAEALLRCTARFPDGRVLSHDAPEGAFLRGGYMGDAAFSDVFPARPLSYFKRQHRWIRGDWQNLSFIFTPGLRDIERWRLFDSLRRSLLAPATLIAILCGLYMPSVTAAAAWASLMALLSRLLLSLAERALQSRGTQRRHRYARILSGAGGAILQTFLRLWLLPYEAWISLSAISVSLWRMLVSHRRLLQWQTAAQSDCGRGLAEHVKAMLIPMLLGLGMMLTCPAVMGKSAGLMWLLSPAAAAALALNARKEQCLSEQEQRYLRQAAAESYHYLDSFHQSANHFLPPDNFQEQPPVGLAKRSSPTNIGLALTAAVAAMDLGLMTGEKLLERVRQTVDTLEKMPRAEGHFYNWYDIESLQPLQPAIVSTVDSGNLYAGLLTVRTAVEELGDLPTAMRLEGLMSEMDFSLLYDQRRELFHICYDPSKKQGVGGWYDLMASEAMLTSYLATAKGDVPVRHWRRLSRAQLQKDGYRGLASWTGTMFEYLMPNLFLPIYRGSLLYESGRLCLYSQKKRVWAGKPWGISESAFYSLDRALNYRYKAHGVAALALKRGQDMELVVSPYSSFLALAIDPCGSIKNLQRLEHMGARGRYGFIEALDFTPGRCRSANGEQVRCYMAHHVGMSVTAAANALCGGSIRQRFMRDPAMNAFSLLLQERQEEGGVLIRRDSREVPERFARSDNQKWVLRGGIEDRCSKCCVLSNGAYSLLFTNSGRSRAFCGPITLYDCGERDGSQAGVNISLLIGGQQLPLLPDAQPELWELSEEHCLIRQRRDGLSCCCGVSVAYGACGELRTVSLCAQEDTAVALSLEFRPILAPFTDFSDHTAFWNLGIQAQQEGNMLLLHRLKRGRCSELWLGLACNERAEYAADRQGGCGNLSQPWVSCRLQLLLKAGESRELRFAMGFSTEREEALRSTEQILRSGVMERGNMIGAAALHLKMGREEIGAAMELMRRLWQEKPLQAAAKRELWQYGISGEQPIVCCDARAVEAEALLRRFCLLKSCNAEGELVFFSDEEGEYRQPTFSKLSDMLDRLGLAPLIGSKGGVFFVPKKAMAAVISRAAYAVGEQPEALPAAPQPYPGRGRSLHCVPSYGWQSFCFRFTVDGDLPSRVWQHPVTNEHFGFLATDCGIGGMWYENARELPVNLPARDPWAISGSEFLWTERGGEKISLFAANDGYACTVEYSPGSASWEKQIDDRCIRTTAFVPPNSRARILTIQGAAGLKLGWTLLPTLGTDPASLKITREGRAMFAQNSDCYLEGTVFTALCSRTCETVVSFQPPAMHLTVIGDEHTAIGCGVCSAEELEGLCTAQQSAAKRKQAQQQWQELLSRLRLRSGNAALDHYMNGWAAYQCIACRLLARTSLYQRGGAYGFRDQLQDSINMLLLTPHYARERILDACRHQYEAGDVMHWWHVHPKGNRGVRTRCSDDLLWLVWALCEYTEKTGDYEICGEEEPFLCSAPLEAREQDRYECPEHSDDYASVLRHGEQALKCVIGRGFGSHGLPFMGGGDWNDAMDRVGGESVWLAWFLAHCAQRFAGLLKHMGRKDYASYEALAERMRQAAENAWSGRWYYRAFYADGQPLGGTERLDSVVQSWAVLAGGNEDSRRPQIAVDSAVQRLVDGKYGVVKLFDPPYTAEEREPGYITSYGEGYRENGGQYTHGAIWLAMACLRLGRCEEAWDILSMILPENHHPERYGAEPFVLPADVSMAAGREGEAGWTWYTGSAGWYFRAVCEELLGMKLREGKLFLEPKLPTALSQCTLLWTDGKNREHKIIMNRQKIFVDGREYTGWAIG